MKMASLLIEAGYRRLAISFVIKQRGELWLIKKEQEPEAEHNLVAASHIIVA